MFFLQSTEEPKWSSDDAKALKGFLLSDLGQRALTLTALRSPVPLDGSCPNKTLVAGGRVEGFSSALHELLSLTYVQPDASGIPTNYPSLDDDSQWPQQK